MTENPLANLSADVAALLGHQNTKEAQASLPRWKRNQIKRDKARVKTTIDLTEYPELARYLRDLANQENIGISSLIIWLIALGIENYRDPKRKPSNSRLHNFDVILPNDLKRLCLH